MKRGDMIRMGDSATWPKISVVTPSFNQGRFIRETIDSVLGQEYPNLEYIIVDGGSSDESVSIIKEYARSLNHWVSERDHGQAHALNKGFTRATGDIFAYLNSDDVYVPGCLFKVAESYRNCLDPSKFWLAFSVDNFDENGTRDIVPPIPDFDLLSWRNGHGLHQPGVFWSASMHRAVGGFREDMHYAFDRMFFMQAVAQGFRFVARNDEISSRFRFHADSKSVAQLANFDADYRTLAEWIDSNADPTLRRRIAVFERNRSREQARNSEGAVILDVLNRCSLGQRVGGLASMVRKDPSILLRRIFWGAVRRIGCSPTC